MTKKVLAPPDDDRRLEMAMDELVDAAAQGRAAVLSPSQARLLLLRLRRHDHPDS